MQRSSALLSSWLAPFWPTLFCLAPISVALFCTSALLSCAFLTARFCLARSRLFVNLQGKGILFVCGNTGEEICNNWYWVLLRLLENSLTLTSAKTVICLMFTTVLDWKWNSDRPGRKWGRYRWSGKKLPDNFSERYYMKPQGKWW